jgi:hypothetical protein
MWENHRTFQVIVTMHTIRAIDQGNGEAGLKRLFLEGVGHGRPSLSRIFGGVSTATAEQRTDEQAVNIG